MSRHLALSPNQASLQFKGLFSSSFQHPHLRLSSSTTINRHTTDTTADILPLHQDTAGAPQSTTPPSLRKLAMSHLMGAALSANTSPTIHANGDGHDDKVHHGALPPPGAPALTNALKTLTTVDSVTSNPQTRPNYDSPYSRSISSTAPASPRM
jgi:6-phosphofructo-2-kinase